MPLCATSHEKNQAIKYTYKSIPIPGGGFVTGFLFHPKQPDILYCRTDIGGNYRYDFKARRWISLVGHVTDPGQWETFPLAIAIDSVNPDYLYTVAGEKGVGKIAFSNDRGDHWAYFELPVNAHGESVWIHGNDAGRATGERLAVDPNEPNTLYLGTMRDGLFKTSDRCRSWEKLTVAVAGKQAESCITLVEIDPEGGKYGKPALIVVGTNGQGSSPDGNIRGQSGYVSADGGRTFKPLSGEPAAVLAGGDDHPGYIAQRAVFTGGYLFVTYAALNGGWSDWRSCSCDTGLCTDGAVMRYRLDQNGEVQESLDVTPSHLPDSDGKLICVKDALHDGRRVGCGMGGLCADPQKPGVLLCSTITRKPDCVLRSTDFGVSWKPILSGLEIGKMAFTVPYMRPEYNGGRNLIHWLSDIKINPFNSDMALFNTGTGIFMTRNLTDADKGGDAVFTSECDGLEETVHLNIYSPPSGDAHVIDILGDLGGFVFTDLDRPAENTFADKNGDRWITCMNADFPDVDPQLLIATPRGNWTGETKGGLILSRNQGRDWVQLKNPLGLSPELDAAIAELQRPNVTSGWAAISADGKSIIWAVGSEIKAGLLVRTEDFGMHWSRCVVLDLDGTALTEEPIKVLSDRVDSDVFYGFGQSRNGAQLFISTDRGKTFHRVPAPDGFPDVTLSGIDSEMPYEIRVQPENAHVIWIALQQHGLYRLVYDRETGAFSARRVSQEGDFIKGVGFGKPLDGECQQTIYCSGTVGGVYGFWRSGDGGARFERINDGQHQFGDIRTITGDPRIAGRVYIGTGTRGLLYGDPTE